MLLPIKAICDRKKARKDGTSLIYIQYCFSSANRTLLNTEIAIPPRFWNRQKECVSRELPPSYGDHENINAELKRMHRVVEDLIARAEASGTENVGGYVKDTFKPTLEGGEISASTPPDRVFISKRKQPELFGQIDDYIKSKERKVCPKALATFKSMKDHLLAYQEFSKRPLSFQSFDFAFYEGFVDFLAFDYRLPRLSHPVYGLKTNTIGKTIKQLRIFLADRAKRKIIQPIDLSDFKILDEASDAIYLTAEEVGRIYAADLSATPHLVEYRDLFVLACLTGLRFSDFSTLRPEDLRNNLLYKKQSKSEHWVVIPMKREAKEIFTEQFKEKLPTLTNAEFNRHIKTIGEIAGIDQTVCFSHKKGNQDVIVSKPKYGWLTTHTARRTFCTLEFLAGTPVKLIMKISGHKTEKDFYKYIRITAEEAAFKVQELWMKRDNMEAFGARKTA